MSTISSLAVKLMYTRASFHKIIKKIMKLSFSVNNMLLKKLP